LNSIESKQTINFFTTSNIKRENEFKENKNNNINSENSSPFRYPKLNSKKTFNNLSEMITEEKKKKIMHEFIQHHLKILKNIKILKNSFLMIIYRMK